MLKLITLGTSHGDPGPKRFNSASVLRTSHGDYLFEAGAPVNALMIRKDIPFSNLKAVFVSHTHEDHIGGLPGLVKSLVKRPEPGQRTGFFLPEKICIDGLLAFMEATHRPWPDELLSFTEIQPGRIYDDGNLCVTAFRTDHIIVDGVHYPTWAFLAESEGVRIVFTGDLSRDLHDFPFEAFDRPAICVMECQHYSPERAASALKKVPVTRFIGVHISNHWDGHARELYRALDCPRFPFEMAEDGMEFDLSVPPASVSRSAARKTVFTAAVLADLHLQDDSRTVKEGVLAWTMSELSARKPDAVVLAGDMTAAGTLLPARRLRDTFRKLPGRFFFTPGNAELRTPESAADVAACLKTPDRTSDLLLLDSSHGRFSSASRALLARLIAENSARNLLTVTHYPPMDLPDEDRWLLRAAGRSGIIGLLACGHLHIDRKQIWSGIRCELVRGLDPDKAIGGPPAMTFFSRRADGRWIRRDIGYSPADPVRWIAGERAALLAQLGLSGMSDPFGVLSFAIREKVPVFEWRYSRLTAEQDGSLRSLLREWRLSGGNCLSVHFPDFGWENGTVTGLGELRAAVEAALLFQAQRVTLHVPRVSVGLLQNPDIAPAIADPVARILQPLSAAGIRIGLENLHMRPGEKNDPDRGFGYTPCEVLSFADLLSARGAECGVHFDLGHARNNAPFNNLFPISSWLARCGARINGCHLHQVTCDENGKMRNHQALTEPFGRLISLASLFLAWKQNQMAPVPLILEIRGGLGPESYLRLREYLNGK